jgi:thioredoxin 1
MTSPLITKVTDKNFDDEVLKSDKLVLIDFYADWCGPCKALAPALDKFAEENPDVKVVKVNVDENPELLEKFKIRSIPTLTTMKDQKAILHMVGIARGADPKEILRQLVEQSKPAPKLEFGHHHEKGPASCPVNKTPGKKGPAL